MRAKATWLALFFIFSTLLSAYVFDLAFASLFNWLRLPNGALLGDNFTTSSLAGFVLAGGIALYCIFVNKRVRDFVEQCLVELEKVAWPTWRETKLATVTVIITCFVAAIILGLFDTVFAWTTSQNLFL